MVLPASMRLRGHRCFNHLHRRGKRFHSTLLVLRTAPARNEYLNRSAVLKPSSSVAKSARCRVAVVVSSKVSKRAVVRNPLRRRLHDHLRSRFEQAPEYGSVWLLLSLKPGVAPESHALLEECDRLLEQAGLTE